MAGLSHGAAGLRPSEHLLDPLADFLGEAVAGMACRAPVDGGAPVGVVLGYVRGDLHLAQRRDEGGGVVVLVRAQCNPVASFHAAQHGQRGLAFGGAGGVGEDRIDDEAVAVLHQDMAHVAQLRCLAARLLE